MKSALVVDGEAPTRQLLEEVLSCRVQDLLPRHIHADGGSA